MTPWAFGNEWNDSKVNQMNVPTLPVYHSRKNEATEIHFEESILCSKPYAPLGVGRTTMKSMRTVPGHLLVRSLICLHRSLIRLFRSLIRLLRTASFARALRSAHSLAPLFTHPRAHKRDVFVDEMNASISCPFNQQWSGSRWV